MTTVTLSPVAGAAAQFLDNSGNVLTGGKLFTYAAGTTTPQATYTSGVGTTFHSNPIILDAAGRVPAGGEIWLADGLQYKFVLTDANDVLIGTWDNLTGINSNFINFYTQEEIQTATAGQTVFTLSTLTYTPGTNSLSVFVDGVNQYDGSSYAYVETNSTTITFTAGLHVGALVKFTTAVSISAGGTTADLVIYNEGDVGAVNRTVESKLQEMISVKDFGATGNGTTDDSAAIQAAIDAAQGKPIYIPEGTYILNTPLELNFSTAVAPTYQPATQLIGAGQQITILINRSSDYGIKNTPTLAQTQESIGVRFSGGRLSGFTLTTDGGSAAGAGGIQLASYWFATLSNLAITSTDANGIYVPDIPAFGSNPDKYSCGSLIVDNCELNANAEWGISAEMYSITWTIQNCYIANNTIGGIYSLGVGHQIIDNSIAGNGTSASTVGGVKLTTTVGYGAPENILIRSNEFDNNWGSHIYFEGYNSLIYQNRFIQDATAGTGGVTYRNNVVAYFDSTVSGSCSNNVIRNNSIRFDNTTTQTITVFEVIDDAGAFNIAFIDNTYSPSAYASNPTYVTKHDFPATRPRIYAVERGIQIAGSDDTAYSYGQVVVTAIGASVSHTSTPSQIKLVGLYNPNISNSFTFDNATWTFIAPYSGQLRITSNNIYRPTSGAVNQVAKIYVYKNGTAYHTQLIPQGFQVSATDQNYTFDVVMSVSLGDDITLFAEVAAGTLSSISSTTSTTTFQMI